ncbi:MAG TPA: adenylate/guanylate cyclase domain-containing protein [Gaiellales bacterium]|jgi:predicted ATPase/class 3 adenylate cyclase|nr:adenylate/guanylate cyclase domain-containing protein [Gaiellales bacterium]
MASILFADIVGFTPLAESRDPEEVRELLGRYFETAREIVQRYGGSLEKFIGDAVVAIWGAPVAQEDDAERAVRSALDLVSAVQVLGAEAGVDLALRAGVSTGSVAVTLGAEGQGMVAGDVVNTTARIQAAAEPGTVLVDEATRRAIEAAIAHEAAGSFALKGKSQPVELWRALRVVGALRGEGRTLGLEPPFVGRVRELSMLKQLLHSTAEDGRAHMVSVSGIGGIGKSRLTWEFEKYLDGLADSFLWHRGRCLSYGDGVAFWALAEIVRMRCRIVEDEGAESAAAKLEETLAEFLTPDEAATVREPLRQLLGMSGEPEGDRNRLFPAWRLFIERMAETSPVVLVIEDIHWADSALLDFVEYLIEWSRHLPLFVLALSRPELAERRPGWGSAARALTSLTLEPLTHSEMLELVGGLAPGAPGELVERIADGAEGVPLYAVETVRMLLDRGLLAREGERLVATADLTTLEIPETLHALVAARLDVLPEAERRLIEDAAVLGKTFTLSGLTAVAGLPETELEPLVASLVRREVLVMQTDPRSPERGQYEFVQALVRTIAYETIGRRERKRRHKAAADYLESLGGEELAEVIAAHYVDAYRLAPDDDDAEQLRDHAKRGLLRAVERARSLAATGEAERLMRAAIELTDEPAERAQLLEEAGQLTIADGRPGDAIGQFEEADELLRELGELHGAARLRARQAEALFLEGRTDESVAVMEPAYSVLRDQEQDADLAALASQYARMLGFVDRIDESIEPLERAIDIAEQLREWATLSHALNTKALVSLSSGRPQEGRTLLLGALRVAEDADDHQTALRAHFNLSFMAQWSDRLESGDDQRGLELSRRIGDRNWERAFLMHQAAHLFRSGDWDSALEVAEESAQEAADQFALSAVLYPLATILAWRGDTEAARLATEASGFQRDSPDRQARATWAWSVGMQRMAAGRWAEAAEAAASWRETGEALGLQHPAVKSSFVVWGESTLRAGDAASARAFVARVRSLPAGQLTPYVEAHGHRIAALLGDCEDPAVELATAVTTLRRIGYRFDLMLALADAPDVSPADTGWAAEARAEALEIARELGAAPIIERLEPSAVPSAAAGA